MRNGLKTLLTGIALCTLTSQSSYAIHPEKELNKPIFKEIDRIICKYPIRSFRFSDYDNDGDDDLFLNLGTRIHIYENVGGKFVKKE